MQGAAGSSEIQRAFVKTITGRLLLPFSVDGFLCRVGLEASSTSTKKTVTKSNLENVNDVSKALRGPSRSQRYGGRSGPCCGSDECLVWSLFSPSYGSSYGCTASLPASSLLLFCHWTEGKPYLLPKP